MNNFHDAPPTYSVVIPCYRSAAWLPELAQRVLEVMAGLGEPFELLLVNDASTDDTWRVIEGLCAGHPSVRGLDLFVNVGQYRATLCGLEHARGDFVLTLDDDFEHPPEEIPRLVRTLSDDPELDCVIAALVRRKYGLTRRAGSAVAQWLYAVMNGAPAGMRTSAFRAMRRSTAEAICAHRSARPILGAVVLGATSRIANVEVEHGARRGGASGYSFLRLASILRDNVVNASPLPLRLVSALGVTAAGVSFALGIYCVVRYWAGKISFPDPTAQVLLITFFGGMVLLSVGLIGEYVIRILHEVSGTPRYRLRRTAGTRIGAAGSGPG